MTDYTQMTDEELEAALVDAQGIQAERDRRDRLGQHPSNIAWTLVYVTNDQGDRAQTLISAMNTTMAMLDPGGQWGPEGDVPIIDDTMAQQIIDALQARLTQ